MTIAPDLSAFTKEEIRNALDDVRHPFELAVYSSENYFNMGAIIRAGHSFLCRKYWMVDFDKFYKKATMGCHKWEHIEEIALADFFMKTEERNIVVFEKRPGIESVDIVDFVYPDNPILFFGSEKFGVPEQVIERSKAVVTIPLYGVHNDLNVSIAAGIAMYDFVAKHYRNKK